MTVEGGKNTHYICDLKMESEIACAHNVVLRVPGLTIDKAGVVSPTLVYDFAAGAGLVAQGLGWQGTKAGRYPVDCDITSPYFVTPSGLKIKKDTFDIIIQEEEPDGWHGTQAGIVGNPTSAAVVGSLYCTHTHEVGFPNRYFNVARTAGFNTDFGVKAISPTGIVTYPNGGIVYMDQPGKWAVYALEVPRQTQSGIGDTTWNAIVTTQGGSLRVDYGNAVIQGSGIHYLGSHIIALMGTGAGNPFSVNKDMLISYRLAGGTVPDTTRSASVGQVNFVGSVTRFGLLGVNMSGYRPSSGSSYAQLTINTFAGNTAFTGATITAIVGGA